jgi:hypothetical protein
MPSPFEHVSGDPLLGLTGYCEQSLKVIETERGAIAPLPGLILERPSRMLKKSLFSPAQPSCAKTHLSPSGVLALLRGSTYRTEYASPLRVLRPCWTNCLSILRLQGEARICDKWALGQSRNGKYLHVLTRECWYPTLAVLLVLALHFLLQRLLNLDRRELQDAKPTRAAAIVGADRLKARAAW